MRNTAFTFMLKAKKAFRNLKLVKNYKKPVKPVKVGEIPVKPVIGG